MRVAIDRVASSRRTRRARGFTILEVIMALGIMTTGAMALLGFQKQVARSNRHARNVAIATQIAENWLERLKVDARTWVQQGDRQVPTRNDQGPILTPTQWLKQMSGVEQQFFRPVITPGLTPDVWNAFDIDGLDQAPSAVNGIPAHRFCSSMRFRWVRYGIALRADVRVWWPKDTVPNEFGNPASTPLFAACEDKDAELMPSGPQFTDFHVVYLSTVLRPNLPQ